MKSFGKILLASIFSIAVFNGLQANGTTPYSTTVGPNGNQATGIIEIEDMWGVWVEATNPSANAMQRIRVLDAHGTIVYIDRNANPEQEYISYQGWAPGTYRIQVDMESGFSVHLFVVD